MNDDQFINQEGSEQTDLINEASNKNNRFPVRTQLILLSLLLIFIFAGLVIPKSLALLRTPVQTVILPANSVTTSNAIVEKNIKLPQLLLTAKSAFVFDLKTGKVLLEKNADEILPLASITKLMTTLVAYELIPEETSITVSNEAANQQSGGPLEAGEKFNARDLASFALISSYNSAAHTLADSVGRLLGNNDPVTQFVAAMNITARELDLKSLTYKNPTGLDISTTQAGAYGSARDTTFLLKYILENHPSILTSTVLKHTKLYSLNGNYHEAYNTNESMDQIPNLLASKTGYTDLAGGNLTIAFDTGYNHPILITVLGSTYDERFSDIEQIVRAITKEMNIIE